MKDLKAIKARDVLNKYVEMYESDAKWTQADYDHFEKAFDRWLHGPHGVYEQLQRRKPVQLSLSKTNYLGKKTRALLAVMELKEPKTLGTLFGILWEAIPESVERADIKG